LPIPGRHSLHFPSGFNRKGKAFPHIERQSRVLILDIESARAYCLSFPHATEKVLWGNDLVFKIGGKMFAVVVLEGASKYCLSFKVTPERFAQLTEEDGIDPAPYSARYHWIALERFNALKEKELKTLLRNSYDLVFEKLPKKVKAQLG
jgi:predicted DNA-binding protein (MmcQ/YjbR family)